MSIKTILVHLADDDQHRVRLDVAYDLARKYKAHLEALFITTPITMPAEIAGRGASAGFLAAAAENARERAEELEKEYLAYCKKHRITFEWIVEEGTHLDLLAYHAHLADLAVVSQTPHETLEDRFRLHMAEELTMVTGCPVLVLPIDYEKAPLGKQVMVAWKSNSEAVRAVRGTLDIMRAADKVTVLSVGTPDETEASEAEAVAYLARHGVKATPLNVPDQGGIGKTLLAQAEELGVDLMIMGAYGHSRLREVLLGGVTRHVFDHAKLPVIMAH